MIYFDFLTGKLSFINQIDLDTDQVNQPTVEFGDRGVAGDVVLDMGDYSEEGSLVDLQNRI